MLELTDPWFLLGLAGLPVLAWYYLRGLTDFARWQRTSSVVLRSLILILLVLALCGITWLKPSDQQYVVFAVDDSLSVGEEGKKQAEEFLAAAVAAQGPHRAAFLKFAADPGPVRADRTATTVANATGTDIAAAIQVAVAAIPPGHVPRVVLLSDGNSTNGDAVRAALRAGVPVSTVPLAARNDPEVQLAAVNVPAQVRDGEPFYVEVVINSNHDDEVDVEVFRGAHKVVSEKVKVGPGETKKRFRQQVTGERLAEYTARVKSTKDTLLDNNAARGLVFTAGKPRVLLIDSDPKQAKHLEYALTQEGIKVETRPPQGVPSDLSDLQNYECVVLSNVPATSMTTRQMKNLRTYVQDLGGGLVMVGGDQSFGLGGYYKTDVEEILPVRSDFEKEKEKPSLVMVLVVDKSGSMGGTKIEMAKDAAKAAVELLAPKDKVGIVVFDGDFWWLTDIQSAANKGSILDKIAGIEAGGGTNMGPPMEAAYEALQAVPAKLKHVIMLTDGVSEPADFDGIAQNMAGAKITVSTVAVGDDCDFKVLQDIARIGNGRYYHAEDPNNVPQIFAKETVTASKSAINEQPFTPIVNRPSQALADVKFDDAPFLLGYVTTRLKPTSESILITEKGDPLLSWWRYGLGMSVAFTSDAKSRWAAEWVGWPGFSKFWSQIVRHAMRKGDAKGTFATVEHAGGKATLTVDAVTPVGNYVNGAVSDVTVIDPSGSEVKVTLAQTAPGRYAATFDAAKPGTYHLNMNQKSGNSQATQQSRGLVVNYDPELRIQPTNTEMLKQVAASSGGKYEPTPADAFAADGRTATRPEPVWPWLLAAALVLFVFDVALRRIDFDLLLGRRSSTYYRPRGVPA